MKIRGWYKGDDGQMHEMEGAISVRGVLRFPHVPTGGVMLEGVDMSGISPVYMKSDKPAQDQNSTRAENVDDMLNTLIGDACRLGQENRLYAMPELEPQKRAIRDYIARLQARQITPEMMALWDEYQAVGNDDYHYHAERFKGRLWQMFVTRMGGG